MPKEFIFYDYIDDAGVIIEAWLKEKGVKARFDTLITYHLEVTSTGEWGVKSAKLLDKDSEGAGLIEIRRQISGEQYRLLGFFGTERKEVTLVGFAMEIDSKFVPASACKDAQALKIKVIANPIKNRRIHGT